MAPAFSAGTTQASASTVSLQTLTAIAVPAGALVVLDARIGAIGRTITVMDTTGNTWPASANISRTQTTDGHEHDVFLLANSAGGATVKFTVAISGAAASVRFSVEAWTGMSATATLDGTPAVNQFTGTTAASSGVTGVTTTNANSVLFNFVTGDGGSTLSAEGFSGSPGGSTTVRENISTFLYSSDNAAPGTTGTYGATGTFNVNCSGTAICFAVLPAATNVTVALTGQRATFSPGQTVAVTPPAGYAIGAIQTSLYSGGALALSQIASPASAVGDVWYTSLTVPGGYLATPQGDSTVIVAVGSDSSRQYFNALLFRTGSSSFDGPVRVYIDEIAPVWNTSPLFPPLVVSLTMAPVNLNSYVVSTEGDPMTFGVVGTLPPGIVLDTNTGIVSGAAILGQSITGAQIFPFAFTATDTAGVLGTTQSPNTSMTVSPLPTIPVPLVQMLLAPPPDTAGAAIDAQIATLQALVDANLNPLIEYQLQQALNQYQVEAVDHYMSTGWGNAATILGLFPPPAWDAVGQRLYARVAFLQSRVDNPPVMPPGNRDGYGASGWTTIAASNAQRLYAAQMTLVNHIMDLPGGTPAATILAGMNGAQTNPGGIPFAYKFASVGFTDEAIE